jgi:nucleoside 2-deoxyribosyltransferase
MKLQDITPDMLVYVAGPYSGTPEQVNERMVKFYLAMALLIERGINGCSPLEKHAILAHRNLPGDWAYWGHFSEVMLKRCDVMIIIMLEDWEKSTGVAAEIKIAKAHSIPIIYLTPNLMERV